MERLPPQTHSVMGETQETGLKGEQAAAEWLDTNGFSIRHRNWRSGRYELDIVAAKDDTLHFVEVKCRKRGGLTTPEEAITPAKFRSLSKAAKAYIATFGIDSEIQFDLISVEHYAGGYEIRYVPNAMIARW